MHMNTEKDLRVLTWTRHIYALKEESWKKQYWSNQINEYDQYNQNSAKVNKKTPMAMVIVPLEET